MPHLDALETRPHAQRVAEQYARLPAQLAYAREHSPAYAQALAGLDLSAVTDALSWSSFFEHPDRESAAQACTDAGLSWHCLSNSAGLILPSAEFRRFWL